jgi:hypothetical protein
MHHIQFLRQVEVDSHAAPRTLILEQPFEKVDRLRQSLDCLESPTAPHGANTEAFARVLFDSHDDHVVSLVG